MRKKVSNTAVNRKSSVSANKKSSKSNSIDFVRFNDESTNRNESDHSEEEGDEVLNLDIGSDDESKQEVLVVYFNELFGDDEKNEAKLAIDFANYFFNQFSLCLTQNSTQLAIGYLVVIQ
jgi:hypothetical protein